MSVVPLVASLAALAAATPDLLPEPATAGTTLVEIGVAKNGHVSDCRIAASSGNARLDERACSLAATKFRLRPARRDGWRVASRMTVPIHWSKVDGKAR